MLVRKNQELVVYSVSTTCCLTLLSFRQFLEIWNEDGLTAEPEDEFA